MKALGVIVTCEHATNRVPMRYRELFDDAVLRTHRAYDPGALALARALSRAFSTPLLLGRVTRLLVELNRSRHRPGVFSEYVRALSESERQALLARYYDPHQSQVREILARAFRRARRIVHVGAHSFTPVLSGKERNADIGVLFDPRRPFEAAVARAWQSALKARCPTLVVRRNYPYLGRSDGLTTALRKDAPASRYAGIELELNQKHALSQTLRREIVLALGDALQTL